MEIKNRLGIEERKREPFYQKIHKLSLGIALVAAVILTAWVSLQRGMLVEARTDTATEELAKQVLRFHVLADSDSSKDQQVKMQVKKAVIAYLQEKLGEEGTLAETKQFVKEHLDEIIEVSSQAVRQAGSSDSVTAELVTDEFPEKTYGDVTFPAGSYEALRICIGSGKGHNWWCCLYPNLCFTDAVHARVVPEDKQKLQGVLDEDAYEMITCTSDFKIKWFFFTEE